jgi:hypothetical protein
LSFRRLKQGPGRLRCLCFFWRAISLSAHLADFLFARRRPGDRFATARSSADSARGYCRRRSSTGTPRHATAGGTRVPFEG